VTTLELHFTPTTEPKRSNAMGWLKTFGSLQSLGGGFYNLELSNDNDCDRVTDALDLNRIEWRLV
jgi:hypothetical protein